MELRDYVGVLARRWLLVVGAVAVCVGLSAGLLLAITPTYRAQTQLYFSTLLDPGNAAQQLNQGGAFTADRVRSYEAMVANPRVLNAVIADLALPVSPEDLAEQITADAPAETAVITVTVEDASPELAAAIANDVALQLGRAVQAIETPAGGTVSPVRAEVVAPALVPIEPVAPAVSIFLGLGLLVGLTVGVGAAIAREVSDTTVHDATDVARVTQVPVLASVLRETDGVGDPPLASPPTSIRRETFRHLRANVHFVDTEQPPRTLMVAGGVAGEGKSFVVANLAVAFASSGRRTVLVDGDLRSPTIAGSFGLGDEPGLSGVLEGRTPLEEAVRSVAPNLWVLAAGALPPNPNELLSSAATGRLLARLGEEFDMVLIDTPPALPLADAGVLATQVDAVLLVARAQQTTLEQLTRTVESLRRVEAPLEGIVLTMVPAGRRTAAEYGPYPPDETRAAEAPAEDRGEAVDSGADTGGPSRSSSPAAGG